MADPEALPACPLSASDVEVLRGLVGRMIPGDHALAVPGADDPAIVSDMIRTLGREGDAVRRLLALVQGHHGMVPVDVQWATDIGALVQSLRRLDPGGFAALEAVVVRTYYRDDRVMRSIGMEPRPPFPRGYDIEEGDWSLLDPVRARGPVWRPDGS